jgi:xanthine/uracil permease
MRARTIDVNERPPLLQALPLSLQHLFAMFGATVLVPFLVGLDTSVTLFTSGVGTLLYILVTKGRIPAYLGSSFAFISTLTALLGVSPGQLAPPERIAVAVELLDESIVVFQTFPQSFGYFFIGGWPTELLCQLSMGFAQVPALLSQ